MLATVARCLVVDNSPVCTAARRNSAVSRRPPCNAGAASPTRPLSHRRARGRFREGAVSLGSCNVLLGQRGLLFPDRADRKPGLLRHGLTVLTGSALNNHRRYPSGRRICTPAPSWLIRTVAPA